MALEPQLRLVLFRHRNFHLTFQKKRQQPAPTRAGGANRKSDGHSQKTPLGKQAEVAECVTQECQHPDQEHSPPRELGASGERQPRSFRPQKADKSCTSTTRALSHGANPDLETPVQLELSQRRATKASVTSRHSVMIRGQSRHTNSTPSGIEATDNAKLLTDRPTNRHTATSHPPQLLPIARVGLLKLRGHVVVNPLHHAPLLRRNLLRVVRRGSLKASSKRVKQSRNRVCGPGTSKVGLNPF